jgi:NAD(P)H-dependent FMN reductase
VIPAGCRRVLCLPGSLRRVSANRALLLAARQLAPATLELTVYDGLGALPLFNPDLEAESLPAAAAGLRRLVGASDALLIACPEYAHGVPGVFKNLLDWLVGSLEFPGKPVALWNASGRGSHHAQEALREVLATMSARLLEQPSVTVPLPGAGCTVASILGDDASADKVRNALGVLDSVLRVGSP